MEYKRLGNTGLKISAVGLGCGNFGGVGSAPAFFGHGETEAEAHVLMDTAWEMGINFFDTADAYGGGRSEAYIGNWLRQKGSHVRDQLILSTKVFNPIGPGPNDSGLSRRHIMRQIDASLTRLGVDHVDFYLIHELDPTTPLEETLDTLNTLIQMGKVRYIGASNIPAWQMVKALWISDKRNLQRFEWIQNGYSLLDRRDEQEMFPLCADQRLGYTPFSPLAGGFLTGKYKFDEAYPEGSRMTLRPEPYMGIWNRETFEKLEALAQMAADLGVTMAGLALAWVMGQTAVTAPIVGPRRLSHFTPIHQAIELRLAVEQLQAIAEIFKG